MQVTVDILMRCGDCKDKEVVSEERSPHFTHHMPKAGPRGPAFFQYAEHA